jgi:hypothetical protein
MWFLVLQLAMLLEACDSVVWIPLQMTTLRIRMTKAAIGRHEVEFQVETRMDAGKVQDEQGMIAV